MGMDLTEAYKIVYQDLMKNNSIVRGELDFKNLRKYNYFNYIDGVEYLMEIIAAMAERLDEYYSIYDRNYEQSRAKDKT